MVPAILNLVDENLLDAVLKVYLNMSYILHVLSSSSYVNIGAFNQLVKETSPFLGEKFPWVMSNFTLHQFQHAGQLMEENGSRGLGELPEEGLEAINKDLKYQYISLGTDQIFSPDPSSSLKSHNSIKTYYIA